MMFLTEQSRGLITDAVKRYTGRLEELQLLRPVHGGSINKCYQMGYGEARFFLKVNSARQYPGMLRAEAEGLRTIADTHTIKVPLIIDVFETQEEQVLVLEWIESGPNTSSSQESLGRSLANLHSHTNDHFGLEYDNYMGSLPQSNTMAVSWSDFFIKQRLKPQVELGQRSGVLSKEILSLFDSLYQGLDGLSPAEKPAFIHGDLWCGNYMISSQEEPVLIDPAVCYSNREADIAMTMLFGGFQSLFYEAYNEVFPLEPGWEERLDLWNLYPLLVHLNLFGVYLSQIKAILTKYV